VGRPVEPPAVRPSAPAAPDLGRDEAAIRDLLAQLTESYRRLDANAVRRLWPSAPPGLPQSFNDARAYEIDLQNQQISVRGDTATVSTMRRIRMQPKAGRVQENSAQVTFSLTRAAGGWIIDSIR